MNATPRRVALVQPAGFYVGPALCRQLASTGHNLVTVGASEELVGELEAMGAAVEVVADIASAGPASLVTADGWAELVARCLDRFGRLDAAAIVPPAGGPATFQRGPFLEATVEQLRSMYGYLDATFHALQAVVAAMRGNTDGGQVVVFTSDAGARPEAGWSLYGGVRAGQNFLVRAVALEHAADGLRINAIGSKNAIFEGFPNAPLGAVTDDSIELGSWSVALQAETPLPQLGTMNELAAFAAVLLDGRNRFQTAQYFSYSGGWNAL